MGLLLSIKNLRYKDILNDISIDLESKKFYILVGANGCGKTTLVKAIAGLIKYDGSITFDNNSMSYDNIALLRKDMGIKIDCNILFEGTALYNITYPLMNLGYSLEDAKSRAYDLAEKLDISYLLVKNIKDISFMEKELIVLASVLVHEPKLVIIDSSLEELNYYYKNKVITYLKKMKKSTILYISNKADDYILADYLLFMKSGKIIGQHCYENLIDEEKLLSSCNSGIPFMIDLSLKLKSYELIEKPILDINEMVDEIWK